MTTPPIAVPCLPTLTLLEVEMEGHCFSYFKKPILAFSWSPEACQFVPTTEFGIDVDIEDGKVSFTMLLPGGSVIENDCGEITYFENIDYWLIAVKETMEDSRGK